jgi:hypothetical protein
MHNSNKATSAQSTFPRADLFHNPVERASFNGGLLQGTENVWQYETADRQPGALATENPAR